jgi:4'-phosphopantetheinyl transferase EntD
MPCEKIKQLEQTWRRKYEKANHAKPGERNGANPARKTENLTARRCRADQALAAYAIQTHRKTCPLCHAEATL